MHVDVCSHTHAHTKQLFLRLEKKIILLSLNGWESECKPTIIVKTQTLTLSVMLDCSITPFAFKLYSQQLYILTGKVLSYHSVHPSVPLSPVTICCHRTNHALVWTLFRSTQKPSEWSWCHSCSLSPWCHWVARASDEGYLPSGVEFITVVWRDIRRCVSLVETGLFVSSVCARRSMH